MKGERRKKKKWSQNDPNKNLSENLDFIKIKYSYE